MCLPLPGELGTGGGLVLFYDTFPNVLVSYLRDSFLVDPDGFLTTERKEKKISGL